MIMLIHYWFLPPLNSIVPATALSPFPGSHFRTSFSVWRITKETTRTISAGIVHKLTKLGGQFRRTLLGVRDLVICAIKGALVVTAANKERTRFFASSSGKEPTGITIIPLLICNWPKQHILQPCVFIRKQSYFSTAYLNVCCWIQTVFEL